MKIQGNDQRTPKTTWASEPILPVMFPSSYQEEMTMTSSSWPRVFQSQPSTVTARALLMLCLGVAAMPAWAAPPNLEKWKPTIVHCSAGQSLNQALAHAKPGERIHIQGTCRERVVIRRPVTLDGAGSAVIDGTGVAPGPAVAAEFDGLVVINGITGVSLVGLSVQNAATNGILAARGAAVVLRNITVRDNAATGILVMDNSTAKAIDSSTHSNRLGFDVVTSSSLVLKGSFTSSHNATSGGDLNGESIVELRGAQVVLSDNQQFGLIAGSRSQLAIFGWEAAQGSTLTASGNGVAGLGFAGDSSLSTFSDSVITATDNGIGLLLGAGSRADSPPFAGATFVLHHNDVGMNLRPGSSAFMIARLNVHDNGIGVLVDQANLHLEATPALPASIAGNGSNVQLTFGSRSTIQNVSIATPLVCDSTILSRGTTTCP
jgi:nitrous oxidase accessory protein NosD